MEIKNKTYLGQEINVQFVPPKKWYQSARWKLLKEYVSHNGHVTVPVGFISDGATVPPFLYNYFSPTGRYFGAAIIHDYILWTEHDWSKANREFKEELSVLDVVTWRRWPMIWAVRVWAFLRETFLNDWK